MKFNWGHGILIFMILFVSLSIIFIIFSLNQSEDLVTEDYYEKGATYSNQIEINKRSLTYNDSISITYDKNKIMIGLCKTLASSGDTLFLYFYRSSDKNADIKLKYPMEDIINISAKDLRKGRYLLKMSWINTSDMYNVDKEISIE